MLPNLDKPEPAPPQPQGSAGAVEAWDKHSVQWGNVGYPLRPCPEDTQIVQRELCRCAQGRPLLNAMLFGVTAEICALRWPANCFLTAVDSSLGMLQKRWVPPVGIPSVAIQGDWRQQPLKPASIQFAVGDGCLSIAPEIDTVARMLEQTARILERGATFVVRSFSRADVEQDPRSLIDEMLRGRFDSFHAFKLRLLMALQGTHEDGVLLSSAYDLVNEVIPDREFTARKMGWPVESIHTIEAYRDVTGRYFFPSLSQLRKILVPHFVERRCYVPNYEIGVHCPTLVLERT